MILLCSSSDKLECLCVKGINFPLKGNNFIPALKAGLVLLDHTSAWWYSFRKCNRFMCCTAARSCSL